MNPTTQSADPDPKDASPMNSSYWGKSLLVTLTSCALGILSAEFKVHLAPSRYLDLTNLPFCLEKDTIVPVADDDGSVLAFERWEFLGSIIAWKRIKSAILTIFGENEAAKQGAFLLGPD
ncbi:uncharacterized protein Bfra_010629 [Botrytis fragariae]|uniref:Uncharacterized protein n=1 Tax=Botrytis fragariae TaxID=1964551 RepID=A0A8H6AHE1_9HELO|nr:uncharacterized protein Bfra_010629 [Botrytis fragariae]KAF5867654.1 hypothetical protein Bfra_010629 [Botrytis fragariae]